MSRCLRLLTVVLIASLPALAAAPMPLVFEVSFPKELERHENREHVG